VQGRSLPASLPDFPAGIADVLLGSMSRIGGDRLWWPYPDLKTEIEFDMIHPNTNRVFFSADPQVTYWRNRWMHPESYEQYRASLSHDVPLFSAQYTLRFKINGKLYQW